MKKLQKISERNKDWIWAIGLNMIILMAILILFLPRSEAGDDSVMIAILSGGYGEKSAHAVFINIFFAGIIELLNKIIPVVNWYIIVQYALIFIAMVVVSKICFDKFGHYFGDILSIVILSLVYYEYCVLFQFSKTSALLVGTGCFIAFYRLREQETTYKNLVLPAILMLLGSMLRFYSFLCTMAIFLIIGLKEMIILLSKRDWKKMVKYVQFFGIVCVICFLCRWGNQYIYQKNKAWSEYQYYNDLRGKVRDFPILPYEGNEELYQSIGMSENDYENLMDWNIADPKFYTTELYENILELSNKNKGEIQEEGPVLIRFFKEYPKKFFSIKTFNCFLVIVLLCILALQNRKKIPIHVGFSIIPGIIISFYLFYMGRYGLNRVDTGIWLAVILVFLYNIEVIEKPVLCGKKLLAIYLVSLISYSVAMGDASGYLWSRSKQYIRSIENLKELYECLETDKSKVYFMDVTSTYKGEEYYLLEPQKEGYGDNVIWLGGWLTNSPIVKNLWKNYDVTNPYKNVIDSDQYFFIEKHTNISTKVKYIRQHYKKRVHSVLLKNINGFKIYAIRSSKYKLDLSEHTLIPVSQNKKIKYKYDTEVSGNRLVLNGYFFEKGIDSFNQTVYLKVVDKKTGEVKYYDTTKHESSKYKKRNKGQYGAFRTSVKNDKKYLKDHSFTLILESNGQYYEKSLKITAK